MHYKKQGAAADEPAKRLASLPRMEVPEVVVPVNDKSQNKDSSGGQSDQQSGSSKARRDASNPDLEEESKQPRGVANKAAPSGVKPSTESVNSS